MGVQLAVLGRRLALFSRGVQLCEVLLSYDMASGVGGFRKDRGRVRWSLFGFYGGFIMSFYDSLDYQAMDTGSGVDTLWWLEYGICTQIVVTDNWLVFALRCVRGLVLANS